MDPGQPYVGVHLIMFGILVRWIYNELTWPELPIPEDEGLHPHVSEQQLSGQVARAQVHGHLLVASVRLANGRREQLCTLTSGVQVHPAA